MSQQDGSALVWAVVILLVLAILVGTVLTLSLSYFTRSVNSNAEKQAYFTAKSAADTLAGQICTSGSGTAGQALLNKLGATGNSLTIDPVQFTGGGGAQSRMGSCRAFLQRENYKGIDTILITATATVGGQTKSLALRLRYQAGNPGTQTDTAFKGMVLDGINSGNGIYTGVQSSDNVDIYIDQNQNSVWMGRNNDSNAPWILGNLYSKSPLTIDSSSRVATHIHGDILSDQPITFTGFATTIGPYPNCCSSTKTDSKIYTTSTVTVSDSVIIYSTITANTVNLNDETEVHNNITANSLSTNAGGYVNSKVYGNLTANTALLKDGIAVSGNVIAGTLTMQGNAVITGNVTANTVVMSGQTKITGTVMANSLTITDSAYVSGNVTAGNIGFSAGGYIDGNVIARSVTASNSWRSWSWMISGSLTAENSVSDDVKVSGAVRSGVAYTADAPSSTPVSPILSILPDKPSSPVLPASSDHQKEMRYLTRTDQVLGNTDGSDSYYTVNGTLSVDMLTTQGEGKIFIYIPSGNKLSINQMTPQRKTSPNVYIIVENGGTFNRSNPEAEGDWGKSYYRDFYGYILGKDGSTIYIGRGTHIYGGIFAESADFGYDVTLTYVPLSGGGSSGIGSGGGATGSSGSSSGSSSSGSAAGWSVLQYEEGA